MRKLFLSLILLAAVVGVQAQSTATAVIGNPSVVPTLTVSTATPAGVLFAGTGGLLTQDPSNFFYTSASKTLTLANLVVNNAIGIYTSPYGGGGIKFSSGSSGAYIDSSGAINGFGGATITMPFLVATSSTQSVAYTTATNCSSSVQPAVCGSAASGSVTIAAAGTSTVVNNTAVTANSQIMVTFDASLGTRLGVTCNPTASLPYVSARVVATSFTIATASTPVTSPACYSYMIFN